MPAFEVAMRVVGHHFDRVHRAGTLGDGLAVLLLVDHFVFLLFSRCLRKRRDSEYGLEEEGEELHLEIHANGGFAAGESWRVQLDGCRCR